MEIYDCRVNHLENPLGYALDQTVFGWKVRGAAGTKQQAARIVVQQGTECVADTGWNALESLGTELPMELKPCTRYTWTVAVRTDAGEEAESAENWFETGTMEQPWQAGWITCPAEWEKNERQPVFSKKICPEKPVQSARLYICGLGLYEADWNGEKIGDEFLAPYCNNYNSWVQYQTYDVTRQLQSEGTLSVTLGNGWYRGRFGFDPKVTKPYYGTELKLIAELQLHYADGTSSCIGTDEQWQVTGSNIVFSNIYDGEQRDDTLPALAPVAAVRTEPPKGALSARRSTAVTVHETRSAVLLHTPAGEAVLDIGQNQAGIFRLKVHLPRGAKVRLQAGEILQDGNFYRGNLRSARAEYCYVSDGAPHVLQPGFTYYGYRYLKVEGIPELKAEDFTALVLYSDLPELGRLETGNAKINRLIANAAWGQKSNFLDVPTDCPQRDERMGWTGDAAVFAPTACYFRDSTAFFLKYLWDMQSEQAALGGMVPMVVPAFGMNATSSAWGDVACILPWTLYEFTGDRAMLASCYKVMKDWLDFIAKQDGENHGWAKCFHFGDWLALDAPTPDERRGGTDAALVALWYYRHSLILTARAARVLDRVPEAEKWETKTEELRDYLRETYFTADGRCKIHTQTAVLLGLQDDLAPDKAVAAEQLKELLAQSGGMLQTGFVGTQLLCPTLTEIGNEKDAFRLLLNEAYPGWLYAVNLGATTIWERWNSVDPEGHIAENGMNSLNHYAYGSVVSWLFADVAGLKPLEPGFRAACLAPHFCRELKEAVLDYESTAGHWHTEWKFLPDGQVHYSCTVPFGCTAMLKLPFGGGTHQLSAGTFEWTYPAEVPDIL